MIPFFKSLTEVTFFRYLIIGGASYLVEISLLYALSSLLLFSNLISVGISFWIGLLVAFGLQKFIAFRSPSTSSRMIARQLFLYGLLILVNYTFTLLFVHVTATLLGLLLARTIAIVITTTWNFFIYKKVIFR